MAYWRRGALCQSLKRPLGERVKVILLAACSIDLEGTAEPWITIAHIESAHIKAVAEAVFAAQPMH